MAAFDAPTGHPIAADKAPGAPADEDEHPDHHNDLASNINAVVDYLEAEFGSAAPAAGPQPFFGGSMMMLPGANEVIANIMGGTLTTLASAANREDIHPFLPAFSFSINLAYISVSTAQAGSAYAVIYGADQTNGRPTGAPTLSAAMDTGTTGTKNGAITFSFTAGQLYWVGSRTTAAPTLRCAQTYAAYPLTWTTGATPGREAVLRRTITATDTGDYPTYATSLHAAANAPWVGMRIAA